MQIIHLNDIANIKPVQDESSVALGNFDGMHIGHKEIIRSCVARAEEEGLVATALTFDPHPQAMLRPQHQHYYLSTLEEKLQYMEEMGIKRAFVINFDEEFSNLSPQEFTSKYLRDILKAKWLFTGYNFYFGHNRQGDVTWLENNAAKFGFGYKAVSEVSYSYHTVSSSNIKRLLKMGAVGVVAKLLGRQFVIKGIVVRGEGVGAPLLQVPTANIEVDARFACPAFGVYLVKVFHNDVAMYGVANIGNRPSLNPVTRALLEVHLFDVNMDLYGQSLTVEFLQLLRPERKFDDVESLKAQIHMDIRVGRYVLSNGDLNYALQEGSTSPSKIIF